MTIGSSCSLAGFVSPGWKLQIKYKSESKDKFPHNEAKTMLRVSSNELLNSAWVSSEYKFMT